MKKILVSMLAAFMVLAVSGSAFAWSNKNLTVVIYNATDMEVGLNLGSLDTFDFTQQNAPLVAAGSFSLSDYTSSKVNSFDDLRVGIFGIDSANNGYFATTSTTAPGVNGNFTLFKSASIYAAGYSGTTKGTKATSATTSYYKKMDNGADTYTPGYYAGWSLDIANGEAVLPAEGGYVDMYLYKYATATDPGVGSYLASFRIFTDGSIVMNAGSSPVPVPGAFILLFSGLLGLVGIRRKA